MNRAFIARWTRTPRSIGRLSASGPSHPSLSLVAFIINIAESDFRHAQATHFLMKRLPKVATEMALHVLAYNLTRVMNIMGIQPLMAAMRACLGSRQGPAFA